jgi:hypothetical protein
MDSDIWLPLATLVGGWVLAQVTEVLRDRLASKRERLARRSEGQRATLLALQDQLLEVFKLTATGSPLEPESRTQVRHIAATGQLLASRVEDDDTRKEANSFLLAAVRLAQPSTFITEGQTQGLTSGYARATNLIGKLLRERY